MNNLTDHPLWFETEDEPGYDPADNYDLMASEYKLEKERNENFKSELKEE